MYNLKISGCDKLSLNSVMVYLGFRVGCSKLLDYTIIVRLGFVMVVSGATDRLSTYPSCGPISCLSSDGVVQGYEMLLREGALDAKIFVESSKVLNLV